MAKEVRGSSKTGKNVTNQPIKRDFMAKNSCGCSKVPSSTSKPAINTNDPKFVERVRQKATELWEKSGRIAGRDVANWIEAERIVKSEMK